MPLPLPLPLPLLRLPCGRMRGRRAAGAVRRHSAVRVSVI